MLGFYGYEEGYSKLEKILQKLVFFLFLATLRIFACHAKAKTSFSEGRNNLIPNPVDVCFNYPDHRNHLQNPVL